MGMTSRSSLLIGWPHDVMAQQPIRRRFDGGGGGRREGGREGGREEQFVETLGNFQEMNVLAVRRRKRRANDLGTHLVEREEVDRAHSAPVAIHGNESEKQR